jgi:SAM-dependent methyltransferase
VVPTSPDGEGKNLDRRQLGEAERLEGLWAGDFGDAYTERNRAAAEGRAAQWNDIFARSPADRVLEVGCNVGGNLAHVARHAEAWGVDINPNAVRCLIDNINVTGAAVASGRHLPFRDGWFDLVFTAGVLIHLPAVTLLDVMAEIVRCSSRWVLAAEYASEAHREEEIPYRRQRGALFRRNYGRIYLEGFPQLRLVDTWFTDEATWDRTTFWLLEKVDSWGFPQR